MDAPRPTKDRAKILRRAMSLPEVLLWRAIKARQLAGLHFRKQHPMGPYVLDFYCDAERLAVEVDGSDHDFGDRPVRDERRDAWLLRAALEHFESRRGWCFRMWTMRPERLSGIWSTRDRAVGFNPLRLAALPRSTSPFGEDLESRALLGGAGNVFGAQAGRLRPKGVVAAEQLVLDPPEPRRIDLRRGQHHRRQHQCQQGCEAEAPDHRG